MGNKHPTSSASLQESVEELLQRAAILRENREHAAAAICLEQALALTPGDARILGLLGKALNNAGQLGRAAEVFQQVIDRDDGNAEAHNNLGHVRRSLGELAAAAASFGKAGRLDPEFAQAHKNLGTVYLLQNRIVRAIASLRRGLALAPDDANAQTNLADALLQRGHHKEAQAAYRAAVELEPRRVDALIGLAATLQYEELFEQALASYRAAFEIDPANEAALYGLASMLEILGRYDEGLELARAVIRKPGAREDVLVAAARLLRRVGATSEAIELIQPALAAAQAAGRQWPRLYFTLGDLHDDIGDYELAFTYYQRANRSVGVTFDTRKHIAGTNELMDYYSAGTMARLPRATSRFEQPVFIVGMPRSGTTLVEQIVAAHPDVYAAGEVRTVFFMARDMSEFLHSSISYPACMDQITAKQLDMLAARYLDQFGTSARQHQRITDKLPANFLNLGLIELLFPAARIIHCQRDAKDACLSCYFQNFRTQSFSHDLEHIGVYYRQYAQLMHHWRSVSKLPILDVQYEELVSAQEEGSRRLIDFLSLEWDPRCLDFHNQKRIVTTSSYAQVRKPIYRTSIGRHRHYSRHLGPLLAALEG